MDRHLKCDPYFLISGICIIMWISHSFECDKAPSMTLKKKIDTVFKSDCCHCFQYFALYQTLHYHWTSLKLFVCDFQALSSQLKMPIWYRNEGDFQLAGRNKQDYQPYISKEMNTINNSTQGKENPPKLYVHMFSVEPSFLLWLLKDHLARFCYTTLLNYIFTWLPDIPRPMSHTMIVELPKWFCISCISWFII